MNDIVGFVDIKKYATTCRGAENPNDFIGKTCAVMEFATDGGVLVFNNSGTALAMFDKEDVARSFKCGYSSGVVCPPKLNIMEQMMYINKAQSRKGGYNEIVCQMVIQSSLMKGEFYDYILWAKQ